MIECMIFTKSASVDTNFHNSEHKFLPIGRQKLLATYYPLPFFALLSCLACRQDL